METMDLSFYTTCFKMAEGGKIFFVGDTDVVTKVRNIYYLDTRIQQYYSRTKNAEGNPTFSINKEGLGGK